MEPREIQLRPTALLSLVLPGTTVMVNHIAKALICMQTQTDVVISEDSG